MSKIGPMVAVGLALVVAGCGTTVVRGVSETASEPPPPRIPVLKSVDACSLLTPEEAASIGLPPGRPDRLADLRECKVDGTPEERRELKGKLTIDEGPGKGADDLDPPGFVDEGGTKQETAGEFAMTSFSMYDGQACLIHIDVNTDENVTVQTSVDAPGRPEPVCEVARKMVRFIVPRLPKK